MQTNIVPVAVFPSEANVLYVRSITLGPPPAYYYELQNVTDGVVTVLKNGNIAMTEAQWNAWGTGADDTEYQLDAIAANLGVERE
jgi:hypothetical protein